MTDFRIRSIRPSSSDRMMTTTRMMPVVLIVSSRVGQTTLRISNCDSARKCRTRRPSAVNAAIASAITSAASTPSRRTTGGTLASLLNQEQATTPATRITAASTSLPISATLVPLGCSALVFMCSLRMSSVTGTWKASGTPSSVIDPREDGTPGGTRTPNLRFWRPLLCQLSYWRILKRKSGFGIGDPAKTKELAALPNPVSLITNPAILLDDLGHHAGADGTAAFADREPQALVHRDRVDQAHRHLHVVARHHHLHAVRQLAGARHVRGAEIELRTVALEERGMTTAFILRQHVHLGLEVGVRRDRARLRQHLTALHVVALQTAQQQTGVVARLALVQQLAEHLHAGHGGLLGRTDADHFDFVTDLDHAALDTTGHHGAAARDREHVFHRHQERLVDRTHRLRDVAVQRIHQLDDRRHADLALVAFQRLQRR